MILLCCVYKLLVTVPQATFAYVFDAGPFRVRKYESVVTGLGTRVEVVSAEGKLDRFASLFNALRYDFAE